MAASSSFVASVLALTFHKCQHSEEKKLIKNIPHSKLLQEIFEENHSQGKSRDKTITCKVKCKSNIEKSESFEIEGMNQLKACEFCSMFFL